MRIRAGFTLAFDCSAPTPMIFLLNGADLPALMT